MPTRVIRRGSSRWDLLDFELWLRQKRRDGRPLRFLEEIVEERRRQSSAAEPVHDQERPAWLLTKREPAPRRTRTRGLPKLRTGPPRLTVTLGSSARRSIDGEFYAATGCEGVET